MSAEDISYSRTEAKRLSQSDSAAAELAYQKILQVLPSDTEAHVFMARMAFQRKHWTVAQNHLQAASTSEPNNANLWKSLGVAYFADGQWENARDSLTKAIFIAPMMHQAHLHLGKIFEKQGDAHAATHAYFKAIVRAQSQELWLDNASIPDWLREDVLHAMEFVQKGRHTIFFELLEPLKSRFGNVAMQRVESCLAGYLQTKTTKPSDSRQQPTFLFFPDVPCQPYYHTNLFPWATSLQDNFSAIRGEALDCVSGQENLRPFLDISSDAEEPLYLRGENDKPQWNAFFFYRHGQRFNNNHAQCPITSTALENLPLVRIKDHAPEICFSVLTPGTHILPHHGVSNVRLVMHLPLIVPENCAITVGGEVHAWKEGECMVFDDTFLHEAWNRGSNTRTILLMDVWNPHLTEVERLAVTHLIEGMGEFNRSAL
jgi:aspartate beta-hydroxylase